MPITPLSYTHCEMRQDYKVPWEPSKYLEPNRRQHATFHSNYWPCWVDTCP